MSYILPFQKGQRLVEFGGGENPLIRPNIDTRPLLTVDVVADFDRLPLPLPSNAYDGIYSQYLLEHISWRNCKNFLKEVVRILRNNGVAVFVIPNLLEQARQLLVENEDWEEKDICGVFGGQDYPENSHKCGFSPAYAIKIFREVGFTDVFVLPHPNCSTDMIVEARKTMFEIKPQLWTIEDRKKAFNRLYFDGGRGCVGGYSQDGYSDFPVHWKTFEEVMRRKPENVLEIGCGRGYILKRLEDSGIHSVGLEVSEHCWHTRVMDSIVTWDITQVPWPVKDKEFDLCFSCAVLEHIPEDHLEAVFKEMVRVSKRGLHGIDFGHKDNDWDKTHVCLHDKEWWQARVPEGHEVVDKEDLECPPIPIPVGDEKLKLNCGSYTTMFHHGWINMDVHPLEEWARSRGYRYQRHDFRKGIPFENGCVDMLYAHHFLEHLTYREGMFFLRECHRVMKPGGLMRLVIPNTEQLIQEYQEKKLHRYDELNDGCAEAQAQVSKLWALLFSGHSSMYDWETVYDTLKWAGFGHVEKTVFRKSLSSQMLKETLDLLPSVSLFVEAVR